MIISEKEWTHALSMAGSENRAAVLVRALDAQTDKDAKAELLREWFNICDALAPWRHDLRRHFEDVGWVTDADECPDFPCTVYRGAWDDDDVETALSWTASQERAEFFARYLTSPRAWFLGIKRDDATPTIFQATCESALAYFDGRGEQEVVPKVLSDIQAIAELRAVEK